MNTVVQYREKLNLTQEELATKAGLSTRTIQRIEKGNVPKGHTLKVLAAALNVAPEVLKEHQIQPEKTTINYQMAKLINLSSLPFVILPLANIIVPLLIMWHKKQFNPITKQIVSLQILWSILTLILGFIVVVFIKNTPILLFLTGAVLVNLFIILKNTAALDKKQDLAIQLNFNII